MFTALVSALEHLPEATWRRIPEIVAAEAAYWGIAEEELQASNIRFLEAFLRRYEGPHGWLQQPHPIVLGPENTPWPVDHRLRWSTVVWGISTYEGTVDEAGRPHGIGRCQ